jgi:hypothetical protein
MSGFYQTMCIRETSTDTPLGLLGFVQLTFYTGLNSVIPASGVGCAGLIQRHAYQRALGRSFVIDDAACVGLVAVFDLD